MNEIAFMENYFKARWFGVRFCNSYTEKGEEPESPISFCEAITRARIKPVILSRDSMNCPGGAHSFGWQNNEGSLIRLMASKANTEESLIKAIVDSVPRLNGQFDHVIIGSDDNADLYISYAQPEMGMSLLRDWQRISGTIPVIKPSAFLAICGAVAAQVYMNGGISLSFGCPDSRKSTDIGRDRMFIGISKNEVERLMARP